MSILKLNLKAREEVGKNKVDKLRAENIIPGVMYSNKNDSENICASAKELNKIYEQVGTSNIFESLLNGKTYNTLFKEVQKNPTKNEIIHFDLFELDMNQTINVTIPIVLEGRDSVKVQPSVLYQSLDELEIECLPNNLPSEAKIDVSNMQIDEVFTVNDLDIAKNKEIKILTDLDEAVASLHAPKEQTEEEAISPEDVPVIHKTKEAEIE